MAVKKQAAISADEARAALSTFLENNPLSEVIEVSVKGKNVPRIAKPWGDSSVAFKIGNDFTELAGALNRLFLPPRLSAVWHRDKQALEVIWTAYQLPPSQLEIEGRKFDFKYRNSTHTCEFSDSSEDLVMLAKCIMPVGISSTNHRNLYSFAMHTRNVEKTPDDIKSKPKSFWVSDVIYDESTIIEFLSHLNFYITYYDMLSPYVVIHPPDVERIESNKERYRAGKFPGIITGCQLDENLLSFWESAQAANPFMAFLLYFRIIEYAAYHYVDDAARNSISRIIRAPDLLGNVPTAIDGIISALSSTQKLVDSQRIRLIIKSCVKPSVLWPDVRDNQEFFAKATCFEGGFSVDGIVGANDKEENWGGHRMDSVSDSFRKIRNALSHGKDMETTGVIRPSERNINLFQPWVHLISAAAGEVVLYKDAT